MDERLGFLRTHRGSLFLTLFQVWSSQEWLRYLEGMLAAGHVARVSR